MAKQWYFVLVSACRSSTIPKRDSSFLWREEDRTLKKIKVGIIFGGCSPEHEISLLSASNVIKALDPKKYDVVLIGIDKKGKWLLPDQHNPLLDFTRADSVRLNQASGQHL